MGEISKNRSFFRNRVEDTNGGLMPESWEGRFSSIDRRP